MCSEEEHVPVPLCPKSAEDNIQT